jgi:hypothetical protein
LRKAPLEGACGEPRALDHLLHGVGDREMLVQPLLRALNVAIAMVALAFENDVRVSSAWARVTDMGETLPCNRLAAPRGVGPRSAPAVA